MQQSHDVVHVPARAVVQPEGTERLIRAYLSTLQSQKSRTTTEESLLRAARLYGKGSALDVPWCALDLAMLGALRNALALKYAPSTANMTLSAVRTLLKTAFVLGMTNDRQHAALQMIKPVRGSRLARGRAISLEEEKRLLDYFSGLAGYKSTMLRAAMTLSVGGGLRREELCRLAVTAYRPPDTLNVLGKGNKEREVVCDGGMRAALERWLARRGALHVEHGGLFCAPDLPDRPLTKATWWRAARAAADACDVRFSGPHDFRRTFATRWLDAGGDLLQLQRLMAHADASTTANYDKRLASATREARLKLEMTAETAWSGVHLMKLG